jgi:sec-independent protein translocase protein TatC
MSTHDDLFSEEQRMVTMSFGEHLEELRARIILGLMGLMVGIVITFVPPLNLGMLVTNKMQNPANKALDEFYTTQANKRADEARKKAVLTTPVEMTFPADKFLVQLRTLAPGVNWPPPESQAGKTVSFPIQMAQSDVIPVIMQGMEKRSSVITLAPLEGITIFFSVCMVTGLVIASPWVFYQVWAFVAAGLYRHERRYVKVFLPFSLGLFLSGVFLCFFVVLPYTLSFLLEFNVWLGLEPSLRLSEWMGFATILPLIFGLCFQTPLVMLFMERIGVVSVDDLRSKRKYAILIMVTIAAIITPTPDPVTMMILAAPMIALYELGLILIGKRKAGVPAKVAG